MQLNLSEPRNGQAFDQNEFPPYFDFDAQRSQRKMQVETGYVSVARLKKMAILLANRVQAGVVVCAFIGKPDDWDRRSSPSLDPATRAELAQFQAAVDFLSDLGVHVNVRPALHIKYAVIDNCITWEGSLNILSYNQRKDEHMSRWNDPVKAAYAIKKHSLDRCQKCLNNRIVVSDSELDMNLETLGQAIAIRRKALGLSIAEFARLLGVNRVTIRRIEAGSNYPSVPLFLKISRVLDRKVAWLPPSVLSNVRRIIELEDEHRRGG